MDISKPRVAIQFSLVIYGEAQKYDYHLSPYKYWQIAFRNPWPERLNIHKNRVAADIKESWEGG